MKKKFENYIPYADVTRILAAFMVVMLHVSGIRLISYPVGSENFMWAAFFDCLCRWTVPGFIMLSGMLFLDKKKKVSIKTLYTKNILRLVTAFVFWSYLYNFYAYFVQLHDIKQAGIKALINMPNGAMHLWFIFIMIGLYIIVPFLKRMCEHMTKGEAEYFILLSIIITFLPKTLSSFEVFKPFLEYIAKFEINLAAGYSGLFVAGWYINNFEHKKSFRYVSYSLGIAGFLYMFFTTVYFSMERKALCDEFMSFKSISAFLMAFAVVLWLKSAFSGKTFSRRAVSNLSFYSKYTFGIYLVHEMFLNISSAKGWFVFANMPYIGIPLEGMLVFVLSAVVTGIIVWLPFGKYIS
ncbi:MAG: acyltransferase [Clostridia bacterium]